MIKLLKADWYEQIMNIKIYIYGILFVAVYGLSALLGNMEWNGADMSASKLFALVLEQQSLIIFMVAIFFISYQVGHLFHIRFIQVQIISCGNRVKVMLSKYITQCLANVLCFGSFLLIVFAGMIPVFSIKQYDISTVFGLFCMFLVLVLRFTVIGVSLVFIVQQGIFAGILQWFVFIIHMLPSMLATEYGVDVLQDISAYQIVGQINRLVMDGVSVKVVGVICITTILECALYMIAAYSAFKKVELK